VDFEESMSLDRWSRILGSNWKNERGRKKTDKGGGAGRSETCTIRVGTL